jgi:hypothetical protein
VPVVLTSHMSETTKNMTELVAGDVILDAQGCPHLILSVAPKHEEATEWEEAADGYFIVTDREPNGRFIEPVGAPESIKFRVLLNTTEVTA